MGERCQVPAFPFLTAGTFITEWTDGGKMCESFLAGDEEAYHAVAEQLAKIAQFYRFDGWLVNIENSLSVSNIHSFALLFSTLPLSHRLVASSPKPGRV